MRQKKLLIFITDKSGLVQWLVHLTHDQFIPSGVNLKPIKGSCYFIEHETFSHCSVPIASTKEQIREWFTSWTIVSLQGNMV